MNGLNRQQKQKRNRLIALIFACVLLLLVYGPLAQWFNAADRVVYDEFAGIVPKATLDKGIIISIDPGKYSPAQVLSLYGRAISLLRTASVKRIIMPAPPPISKTDKLPDWAANVGAGVHMYVPTRHRLAEFASHHGFVDLPADSDGVLRQAKLWQYNNGVMSPSLPLAVAFDNPDIKPNVGLSTTDDIIYLSRYVDLKRISIETLFDKAFDADSLYGATVFLDSEPALVGATAILPSGQYVTASEITAALLADVESDQAIISPSWISALQWLVPTLIAILTVLFFPDRSRRNIILLAVAGCASLLVVEALMLIVLHLRLDLGRAIVILAGIAAVCVWLVVDPRKETLNSFKRASDFLSAGRLEPAFAEFRRCSPSEPLATAMYKLSIAFEQQAKPERAEAVLEWLKRTQGISTSSRPISKPQANGMPQRLGRYVIEKRIGKGAMGAVYLAKDPRINRPVALKVIAIEQEFEDEELKEARLRFYREAESAGRLTHPNIITVFDAGEDKGLAYIAMEYVPGIPLRDFTDPKRLLAPKRALELAATTAEALNYAHDQGVIHRDIKPANLLYNPKEGMIKISDFGVARMTDNNKTKTGIVLGTPMYMSPEQLGAEELTGLSDLFSLGVTLYELLSGEVPFKASNIAVLMTKITSEEPEPIAGKRAGVPPGVDAILSKTLAKRPHNRFSCGAELAAALRACIR